MGWGEDNTPRGSVVGSVPVQGIDLVADGEDAVLVAEIDGEHRVLMRIRIGRTEGGQLHVFSQGMNAAAMRTAPATRWPHGPLTEGQRT